MNVVLINLSVFVYVGKMFQSISILIFYVSAGLVQFGFKTVQGLNYRATMIGGQQRDHKAPYLLYTCLIIFLSL